jgi:hypothetical protein
VRPTGVSAGHRREPFTFTESRVLILAESAALAGGCCAAVAMAEIIVFIFYDLLSNNKRTIDHYGCQ